MPQILQPTDAPPYPSGSWDYLDRASQTNGVGHSLEAICKLDIAIVGAGIGGLSAAIALRRSGHKVTVYENAATLNEIGAGIQIPPNSTRILYSWGLEAAMKKKSVQPTSLFWKRWQGGRVIARTRYKPEFERWFGVPYYVTHRADLHQVLYDKAVDLGVVVKLGSPVVGYKPDKPALILKSGAEIHSDLIVAADGIKSMARQTILGNEDRRLRHHNMAAYRATVPVAEMKANPRIASSVDFESLNLWVGEQQHVMSYSIVGGAKFNVVITIEEPLEPSEWNAEDGFDVEKMQSYFVGWDPALTEILKMVTSTSKWPVADIECAKRWTSPSKKLVLLGDAAHAMIPFMSIGAAMAVEDAAALAESLRQISTQSELELAIEIYEDVRQCRTRLIHESSYRHAYTIHLPDGPEQQARDKAMEDEVAGRHFIQSPNQWSDPQTQIFAYVYDAAEAIRWAWANRVQKTVNGGLSDFEDLQT